MKNGVLLLKTPLIQKQVLNTLPHKIMYLLMSAGKLSKLHCKHACGLLLKKLVEVLELQTKDTGASLLSTLSCTKHLLK